MSSYDGREDSRRFEKSGHKLSLFLGLTALLLVVWQVLYYSRNPSLIGLARSVVAWLRLNLSMLRITMIVGFGSTLLSIPFMRRRGRDRDVRVQVVPPETMRHERVHPLMLTPRPSRNSQFVIRKTKSKGRIARNRAGERLPPSERE